MRACSPPSHSCGPGTWWPGTTTGTVTPPLRSSTPSGVNAGKSGVK